MSRIGRPAIGASRHTISLTPEDDATLLAIDRSRSRAVRAVIAFYREHHSDSLPPQRISDFHA